MYATPKIISQESGDNFVLYHGDCVDVARGLPADSLHYTIFSPPFISLYTFSDDPRDMSNCADDATFWEHFRFLIAELHRATMPGRLVTIHCMDLPTSKTRDGFIGLRDFPAMIRQAFEEAGFVYHSKVCIWKNPVAAMQRTKSIGLLHKQVVKDSGLSRQAVADYMITLRKLGDNPEPIAGGFDAYHGDDPDMAAEDPRRVAGHVADSYSVKVWQRYASPVWMDIAQSDVLSHRAAREEEDERHISPLQLTPIRRCLQLWSNPGDVVFSPFAGIGSELYCALEMGRKALGAELKQSYFEQAVANLKSVEARPEAHPVFGSAA
jgi:DNA modification methylase